MPDDYRDMINRYERLLERITEATEQNKAVNQSLLGVSREMSEIVRMNSVAVIETNGHVKEMRNDLLKYLKWAVLALIVAVGGSSLVNFVMPFIK